MCDCGAENNNSQVQTAEIDIRLTYPLSISRGLICSALDVVNTEHNEV